MVGGRGSGGEVSGSGSERVCAPLDKYDIDKLIKQDKYKATLTIHC